MVIKSTIESNQRNYYQCKDIYKSWEYVFGVVPSNNQECIFGAGAQFIVSKKKILNHPKEFYENIVNLLSYSSDPIEGHNIERFHMYIFL